VCVVSFLLLLSFLTDMHLSWLSQMQVTLSWDATCAAQMPRLHLILKAQTDKKNKGHCVVSIKDLVSSLDEDGCGSHSFFEPMSCDGVRSCVAMLGTTLASLTVPSVFFVQVPRSSADGRQLHCQFSVSMKIVASPVQSLRTRRRTLAAGMFQSGMLQ